MTDIILSHEQLPHYRSLSVYSVEVILVEYAISTSSIRLNGCQMPESLAVELCNLCLSLHTTRSDYRKPDDWHSA